jgi:hypothetical protein
MKHLKKFNESMKREELQDFCETYLAYLLDSDFSIEYLGRKSHAMNYKEAPGNKDLDDSEIISLKKGHRTDSVAIGDPSLIFSWDEIKDEEFHRLRKEFLRTMEELRNYIENKVDEGRQKEWDGE